MTLIPIVTQGALVGIARDLRDSLPDEWTGGKRYPFYAAGEAIIGIAGYIMLPERWQYLGLAAVAFGAKDLTWIVQHWPCCGY